MIEMFSNALMAGKNIEGSCVTKHAIFLEQQKNIPLHFFTTISDTLYSTQSQKLLLSAYPICIFILSSKVNGNSLVLC